MGERIEKPWGWSEVLHRDQHATVVRIHVVPGGYCSWHRHERKQNLFCVTAGELFVLVNRCDDPAQEVEGFVFPLYPGMSQSVGAGSLHRFENRSDEPVEALEIYVSCDGRPPDDHDIVRISEGGVA